MGNWSLRSHGALRKGRGQDQVSSSKHSTGHGACGFRSSPSPSFLPPSPPLRTPHSLQATTPPSDTPAQAPASWSPVTFLHLIAPSSHQ